MTPGRITRVSRINARGSLREIHDRERGLRVSCWLLNTRTPWRDFGLVKAPSSCRYKQRVYLANSTRPLFTVRVRIEFYFAITHKDFSNCFVELQVIKITTKGEGNWIYREYNVSLRYELLAIQICPLEESRSSEIMRVVRADVNRSKNWITIGLKSERVHNDS